MLVDVQGAITVMADAMTAVNASRRQVGGTARWRDLVTAMITARDVAEGAMEARTVSRRLRADVPGASTHRDWRGTAGAAVTILARNAAEAEQLAWTARDRAEAALYAAGRAREAEREALALAGAASSEGETAYWLAVARDCAARARAADARAGRQARIARACTLWQLAAESARACGRALIRRENAVHLPVGTAVAAAGGRAWIAGRKEFLEDR